MKNKMSFMMCFVVILMLCVCSCTQKPELSADVFNIQEPLCEICYTETGPFGGSERWLIDLKKSVITYECSSEPWKVSDTDKDYRKYVLNEEETARIISRCNAFDFSKWKTRYDNPDVCDGTFWGMKFRYMDGSEREISGANKWPDDFRKLGLSCPSSNNTNWYKSVKSDL
jgi:hypothetical protein